MNNENDRLKQEFEYCLQHYREVLGYLQADIPITCLCLPKVIENALLKQGYERVYDLIGQDLRVIKGLGARRIDILSGRLQEFFTVSL